MTARTEWPTLRPSVTLALLIVLSWTSSRGFGDEVFRFQLFAEPAGLDPVVSRGASGNYLFHALYTSLFKYRSDDGLRPAGARRCRRKRLTLTCDLDVSARWSDGTVILPEHYVAAFRRVIDPGTASPHADLLFAVANAESVQAGRLPPERLGVRALGSDRLEFRFAREDYEFEYKLIHPALSPQPPSGFQTRENAGAQITSGPYRISDWKRHARVHLAPNVHAPGAEGRPRAEAIFVDEDATALTLFETGKLSFVRRLIASEAPRFRGRAAFHQVAQARFDYVAFGPSLSSRKELTKALTHAVDYGQFRRLFDTKTQPGCISLPANYLDPTACFTFDPKLKPITPLAKPLDFYFSQLGGDDIQRAAEWFAGQWKSNLGLKFNLHSEEQTSFLTHLRRDPPAVFRKGVSLDRPTCLAGLEHLEAGHPDNYARLDDAEFNRRVKELRLARTEIARKRICTAAVRALLNTHRVIPLGEMMFTILVDPKFSGWDLNEINQLDLSRLVRR